MIAMCSERHEYVKKRSYTYVDEHFVACSAHRHFWHTN